MWRLPSKTLFLWRSFVICGEFFTFAVIICQGYESDLARNHIGEV